MGVVDDSYLQSRIWDRLAKLISRSELTFLLVRCDREAKASDEPTQWPAVYRRILRGRARDRVTDHAQRRETS
jgi:hypothetical protein